MRFLRRVTSFLHRYFYALGSTIYLFTLGLAKRRHRDFIHTIASHCGYVQTKTILPSVTVEELTDDDTTIQLRQIAQADGNVNLLEMMTLVKVARKHDCRRLMELGTFDGRTTLNLAANSPPDAQVVTLDLPPTDKAELPLAVNEQQYIQKAVVGLRYQNTEYEAKIVQLLGDSATFDFSPYVGTMDFVFVDASHSYEYVLSDSRIARKLLGPGGGVLFWHDYGTWEGVTRALEELMTGDPRFRDLHQVAGTTLACLRVGADTP
jgi:predicted O-methyltransferase YrrM